MAEPVNLVENPGFESKKNWSTRTPDICKWVEEGRGDTGHSLQIEVGEQDKLNASQWIYNLGELSGGGRLEISFSYKTENVVPQTTYYWAMPLLQLFGRIDGQDKALLNIPCNLGTNEWMEIKRGFVLPEGVKGIRIHLILQQCIGKVWFDDLNIRFIPHTPEDTAKAVTVNVKGKATTIYYAPRYTQTDKPLAASLKAKYSDKGYIAFYRRDPKDVYPESIPVESEIVSGVNVFSVPGEYEPAWISIYALRDLKNVRVEPADLIGNGDSRIGKDNIDLRVVKCWPVGNAGIAEGYGYEYTIIPEMLLKNSAVDIPANVSQSFYLTIKVPGDAKPGNYSGEFMIKADNTTSATPLKLGLEVLPVSLDRPDNMKWLMHCTGVFSALRKPGTSDTDAAAVAMQDMREHGVEGIVLGCGYGPPAKFKLQNNRILLTEFPKLAYVIPAMKKAGMKGPLIVHCGDMVEYQVAEALGVERPPVGQVGGVTRTMETAEFKDAFKQALKEIDRYIKKLGGEDFVWHYEGVDEPGGRALEGRPARALWQWSLASEAGFKNAVYIRGDFWKELAPYNYIQKFGASDFCYSAGKNAERLKDLQALKNIPYHYGASGSYEGYPGALIPNRWGAGFLSYKAKAQGEVSWVYHLGGITNPDGLEHLTFYPCITYCASPGELVPTLQWEGIREGVEDYRYLYTLNKLLEKKPASPQAAKIKADLERMLEGIPWYKDFGLVGGDAFNYATATDYRRRMADCIMQLQEEVRK